MTFDFESLSAKVGPLLRIDLSQEGHGEKKISENFPKICFFSSKNVGFCQKVLPEKVFPASRPPKFLSRGTPGDEKKLEKKFVRRSKIFLKVLLRSVRFSWNHFFSFKTMKNIFFSKWQKPSEDIKLEKQLFQFFANFSFSQKHDQFCEWYCINTITEKLNN